MAHKDCADGTKSFHFSLKSPLTILAADHMQTHFFFCHQSLCGTYNEQHCIRYYILVTKVAVVSKATAGRTTSQNKSSLKAFRNYLLALKYSLIHASQSTADGRIWSHFLSLSITIRVNAQKKLVIHNTFCSYIITMKRLGFTVWKCAFGSFPSVWALRGNIFCTVMSTLTWSYFNPLL